MRIATVLTAVALAGLVPATGVGAPSEPTCFGQMPTISGTRRADDLTGTPGPDVIVGLGGDDFISGLGGADLICAGDGFDVVSAGDGPDRVRGDAGDDALNGGGGHDVLLGMGGIDALFGEAGDDRLVGGPNTGLGIEGLIGGPGDDHLDGGAGVDAAQYFDAPRGVRVDLSAGTATGHGSDRIVDVEGAVGSNFDDVLIGDAGGNGLSGQVGADTIRGLGSGSFASGRYDVLSGDDGADRIVGGGGFDMAAYSRIPVSVTVDLAAGTASGQGRDTLEGIEGAVGSRLDDVLLGNAADNAFAPGSGDDAVDGRAGRDTVSYFDAAGSVIVDLAAGLATTEAGTATLARIENVWGSFGNDMLTGDGRDNALLGFRGRDRLAGGPGDDLLAGGAGADQADGGDGFDVCLSAVRVTACESEEASPADIPFGGRREEMTVFAPG